jgi:hypothetical protein
MAPPEPEPEAARSGNVAAADPIVATLYVVVPAGALPGTQLLVRVPASALKKQGATDRAGTVGPDGSEELTSAASLWPSWRVLLLPILAALLVGAGGGAAVGGPLLALAPVPLDLQHALTPGWRHCHSPLTIVEKNPDEDWRAEYGMSSRIFAATTPYQEVAVYESDKLGRVLTLDGVLQVGKLRVRLPAAALYPFACCALCPAAHLPCLSTMRF